MPEYIFHREVYFCITQWTRNANATIRSSAETLHVTIQKLFGSVRIQNPFRFSGGSGLEGLVEYITFSHSWIVRSGSYGLRFPPETYSRTCILRKSGPWTLRNILRAAGLYLCMKSYLNLPLQAALAMSMLGTPVAFASPAAPAQTAQDQGHNKNDVTITRKIRRELTKDKSLSIYGRNVKVITQDGIVTLKGEVRSEEEKTSIANHAAAVAGGTDKVTNELTVKGE